MFFSLFLLTKCTLSSDILQALKESAGAMESRGGAKGEVSKSGSMGLDIPLLLYFLFWYVGNYMVSAH